ncbi:MAG: hypothetical protein JO279_16555 [Verrucomicrobia bacterium]|nr:hypothetical protein [Verrucomicrobiota bacterium]
MPASDLPVLGAARENRCPVRPFFFKGLLFLWKYLQSMNKSPMCMEIGLSQPAFLNTSLKAKSIMNTFQKLSAALLICVAPAFADDRLGVVTHFDQGWNPAKVIPLIPAAGFGWIRDDLNWEQFEPVRGQYVLPQSFIDWVTTAEQFGLKVDLCIAKGNNIYANPYDLSKFSKAVAWLAAQSKAFPAVQAIEILNEPNKDYRRVEGPQWKRKYVNLLNSAYAAIRLAYPQMTVLGLGAKAGDDFTMMSFGVNADGLTAHPYPVALPVPESVDEPPFFTFADFNDAWVQHDIRPRWDTAWGCSTDFGISQYSQSLFIGRRLCQSMGMGVSHTFIYDFKDGPNQMFGIVDAALNQKQSYKVVQRVMSSLSGLAPVGGDLYVNPEYSDSDFDYANFYGFSFQNGETSVAVAWTGNSYPSQAFFTSHKGRLSFTHPAPTHSLTELNPITGETHTVSGWEQYGDRVVIYSADVTNEPVLYIAK